MLCFQWFTENMSLHARILGTPLKPTSNGTKGKLFSYSEAAWDMPILMPFGTKLLSDDIADRGLRSETGIVGRLGTQESRIRTPQMARMRRAPGHLVSNSITIHHCEQFL